MKRSPRSLRLPSAFWYVPCALSAACAGVPRTTYIAPTNQTVTADMEMSEVAEAQKIYVANSSTVAIMVTGVRLSDCENIQETCGVVRTRIRVNPGHRQVVMTVHANNSTRSTYVNYGFSWEPADRSGRPAAVAALDSVLGRTRPDAQQRPLPSPAPASEPAPVILPAPAQPPTSAMRPTPVRSRVLTVGLDSLTLAVGERVSFHGLAAQTVDGDSTRGLQLVVADSTIAKVTGPDEIYGARPGRTEITMRLGPTLTRMLVVVRAPGGAAAAGATSRVVGMVVRPTYLALRVGQRLALDSALHVFQRRASGELYPVTGWSLLVEDESVVRLGTGALIGRTAGQTAIVVEIGGDATRVPVVVKR